MPPEFDAGANPACEAILIILPKPLLIIFCINNWVKDTTDVD